MSIGQIFTDIGAGLTSFIPSFFKALADAFIYLFCTYTTTEAGAMTVTGFSTLGMFMIVFMVISMVYKMVPVVTGFIGRRMAVSRKRRAARASR